MSASYRTRVFSSLLSSRAYSSTPPRLSPVSLSISSVSQQSPPAPYSIARNSRGSLPVYSDIRNGGTRYLVLIKNIRGNIHVRPPTAFLSPSLSISLYMDLHSFSRFTSPYMSCLLSFARISHCSLVWALSLVSFHFSNPLRSYSRLIPSCLDLSLTTFHSLARE